MGVVWAMVAAAAAGGGSTPAATDVVTEPDWLRRPTSDAFLAVFPSKAIERGRDGRAVIRCKVSEQGGLYDCSIVGESPPGWGFGAAGLALAPQFIMRPMTVNGSPVGGGEVTIPLTFQAGTPGRYTGEPDLLPRLAVAVDWARAPTLLEVAAAYPQKGRNAGLGGQATLDCRITATAQLEPCDVVQEEPKGYAFGKAALSLADRFAVSVPPGVVLKGKWTQLRIAFAPQMLQSGPPVTGKARWAVMPSAEDFTAAFPRTAARSGAEEVRAVLRCNVSAEGVLQDCTVLTEEPPGLAVGQMALALAPKFRVKPWSDEGLPIAGGTLHVPIRYRFVDDPAPAPSQP